MTVVAGAAALAWGSLVERTQFTLREVDVPVLPAGAPPLRVLHLSDLHMAPWQREKQAWVRALAGLRPDLIVSTGDSLGHPDGIEGIRAAFDRFGGIPGVFVWGSNDYFGPQPKNPLLYFRGASAAPANPARLDISALGSYFTSLGWTDLNNSAAILELGGTSIDFFGVDDPHRGFDRLDLLAAAVDDLDESRASAPGLSVGVAHAPYRRILDSFVARGADLMFAGHTHGGQVCVPGFGALVTNCDIPREQASGLSVWNAGRRAAWLNVSAGLGTSIYAPIRFACPPEATLLTLTPR
ncbi:MAG: metallophosphatase [Naasia sp.]|jgi:predicted MPP superfamily phosphohydrolase|uniref:metallophosphoesterase n=1 Tax=Naasia sp. TaxID=2546198 RepID=UPI002617A977|nr:metallophosphoesterase [Naasia sp.]MCU1570738.1 metallophosphatase [Naasia sp.]